MLGALIPGVLGAIAGGAGSQTNKVLAAPGQTEVAGMNATLSGLKDFQSFTDVGPGAQDVTAGLTSQRGLADMLKQYAQGGFLPGAQDWQTARGFATDAFQPQQVAMNQAFQQSQQRTAQLAAQLGRPVNDPILQAKLAQEQMQGAERLGAAQSAFASQFAQQLPQQRLSYEQQATQMRQGLASQAMANRQALISMGSNLEQAGMNFRAKTASETKGGGLQGAITGLMGGFGAGAGSPLGDLLKSGGNMFSSIFGGSGGGPSANAGMEYSPSNDFNFGGDNSFSFGGQSMMPNLPNFSSSLPTPQSSGGYKFNFGGGAAQGLNLFNPSTLVPQLAPGYVTPIPSTLSNNPNFTFGR